MGHDTQDVNNQNKQKVLDFMRENSPPMDHDPIKAARVQARQQARRRQQQLLEQTRQEERVRYALHTQKAAKGAAKPEAKAEEKIVIERVQTEADRIRAERAALRHAKYATLGINGGVSEAWNDSAAVVRDFRARGKLKDVNAPAAVAPRAAETTATPSQCKTALQLAANRHQSNIRALEAELQRLPASVRRQP
jgi:hypothetical protein